jgi:hypothetical protein
MAMTVFNLKSRSGYGRTREVRSISRISLASVVIAAVASAWGCSSSVEPADDSGPTDSSLYTLFQSASANISDSSASVAHGSLEDGPPVVRSGYTDPRWVRVGEAYFL